MRFVSIYMNHTILIVFVATVQMKVKKVETLLLILTFNTKTSLDFDQIFSLKLFRHKSPHYNEF